MVKLSGYFGGHAGTMKIYVGIFEVGSGTFTVFSDSEIDFVGSYHAFGQAGTFSIRIQLADGNPAATSGRCSVTLNAATDSVAKYHADSTRLTINTTLNPTPVLIYGSQGGTQIDGIPGHNLWIGQWGMA